MILLGRCCTENFKKTGLIIELENRSHEEVAKLMKESAFFVSVNTHEAFNSTVPEAMAAGCIVVCYEAYGPKDFLINNQNAFVFPNNYVYPLISKLYELIDNHLNIQNKLAEIRSNAYKTACKYTMRNTEHALIDFFQNF
jgi:glycosyltransferase involved in cell wall biosynthesis